jgi:lysyl-tRNA synthetase class 2
VLSARAGLLDNIRDFFRARGVLEGETPALGRCGITDPAIEPLVVADGGSLDVPRYLQSSPEYAMKRLLAAGSGPIFQIARAFRDGEAGARHNPEFSLLEWYRPGMDHHELMAEVAELVSHCLGARAWRKVSYRQLFLDGFGIDPHTAPDYDLRDCATSRIDVGSMQGDRNLWLDLLLSHLAGPRLGSGEMVFVYDFPASQAALARVSEVDGVPVGHRFELFLEGLELANGYQELTDPVEQRARFEQDNRRRAAAGQPQRALDEALLAALEAGLPECSGVALGVDRLLMLALGESDIRRVLAFDWERA